MLRLLIVTFLFSASTVFAQSYPDYTSTTVNDYADLLDAEAEAALSDDLDSLRSETGIEMTVLTLASRGAYAPSTSLEEFATGLFNYWGIGDATRNDGILVLVLRDDREIRIELGAGFPRDWDPVAGDVIRDSFLPAFRDARYQDGILAGSADVIARIARPFAEDRPAPASSDDWASWGIIGAVLAAIAASVFSEPIRSVFTRFSSCPNCGARGTLRRRSKTLQRATRHATGLREVHLTCTSCGYTDRSTRTIPRISTSRSSGFGGGRSSGGGASGRW